MVRPVTCVASIVAIALSGAFARAEGRWETTLASEEAAAAGLEWLARNQGKEGNWGSRDLGLVSIGTLAFLSAGDSPETGKYRENVRRSLNYVLVNAKPSGLLNVTGGNRDMYNHGLSAFMLTQAYGMTSDKRTGRALRLAIKVILDAQCEDGGWAYQATRQARGHDLSLAVMQAKALRGAMDIGISIPKESVDKAIASVRNYYRTSRQNADDLARRHGWREEDAKYPGRFTYNGGGSTTAMAAAGAVCLQEFGQYGDFRIHRSMQSVLDDIKQKMKTSKGSVPFDAYTMYYVSQALYQVGGTTWQDGYPRIRKALVATQDRSGGRGQGWWAGGRVGGKDGQLFGTAVAVFALNIPNRYLPILQQGKGGGGRGASSRGPRAGEQTQVARSKLKAEDPMKALTEK